MCGASGHGRVLRVRGADAPPRAAGQARRGRGLRPARGGHHRLLRGAPLRRVLRHPRRPRAAAVPRGDVHRARLRGLPGDVRARHGARARAVETVEVDRPRRGLPRPHRALLAARRDAPPGRRRSRPTPACNGSVGIGPNRLVAKVASDAEKPQGFVVLTREQACERFAGDAPAAAPRHRREDRRAPGGAGDRHDRRGSRRRRPRRWPSASAAASGRTWWRARTSRTRRRSRASGSRCRSRARRRSTTDVAEPRGAGGGAAAAVGAAVRGPGQERAARAHDRDQGAARRLHDRHPGPHAAGGHQRRRRSWPTSPARCSTSTRRRARCGCSACAWRRSRRSPPSTSRR